MAGRPTNVCCKRFTFTQAIFAICLFGISTLISYVAVSWKLSQQWTPDVINAPKSMTSFMIQPLHSSNMSISIMSHSVFLENQPKNNMDIQSAEKEKNDQTDSDVKNNESSQSDASYEESDFSLWWTDGDGSPLFINASKYDKNGIGGYQSFVFCPIPKVGCSAWKQVMRRIKGIDAYLADDYWSLHHHIENGLEMDRIYRGNGTEIDVEAANKVLHFIDPKTNKSIFHAAFVRDSLERSLSAFLDKCVQSEWHKRYWCIPQSDRRINRFSNFDIFIESIISKPLKPKSKFLQRYSFWGLDYHWLPQNWICDLYKFISRYHIYDADNVMNRKYFFLNIGGNQSWHKFGETGWFHHDNKRRKLLEKLFVIPLYKKFEYVDTVNNIRREHPPGYRGYKPGDTLDISGSLLSENAAHAQHTRHKVYSFYRPDLVSKLIVFYMDDYVLFKKQLPHWICSFVNIQPVLNRLKYVNKIYIDYNNNNNKETLLKTLLKMEREILFGVNKTDLTNAHNLLTFGNTSIWHEYTSIKEMKNMTHRNIHLLNDEFRMNTKLKCFYDIFIKVDKLYGTLFTVIRGISLLLDVLMNIHTTILPNYPHKCLLTQYTLEAKNKVLIDIINIYLNEYIPHRLRLFAHHQNHKLNFENTWTRIIKCLDLDLVEGKIDHIKLYHQWHTENIKLFDQIVENMLYTKNVPRNARYQPIPQLDKEMYQTELKKRTANRQKRWQQWKNKHKP